MADSTPSANAAMIRNIIVGVATSVIGAATLYFLGINKAGQSGKASFLETKEATVKGWKSYVSIDNIEYQNMKSINNDFARDYQFDNLKENYGKEAQKLRNDLEFLLKDETMDNTFISMLKRRLDSEKEVEVKTATYVDNLKTIFSDNTMGTEDKQQRILKENQRFSNMAKGILERYATELEGLAKALNEKYGQSFDLNEFVAYKEYKSGYANNNSNKTDYTTSAVNPQQSNDVKPVSNIPVQPQTTPNQYSSTDNNNTNTGLSAGMFAGDWNSEGGTLHLDNQGFSWKWTDGKGVSQGNWRGDYQKMTLNITSGYNAGYSWTFNLSNLTANSFTMQLENYAQYTYHLVKQ